MFGGTERECKQPFLFSRVEKRNVFLQFPKRKHAKGAFHKAAPLEPLLNHKGKPHRDKKAVQFHYVVPRFLYNAQKGAQLPSTLSSYNQRDHAVERVSSAAGG